MKEKDGYIKGGGRMNEGKGWIDQEQDEEG